MKRCPKCNRTYTDETLNFCLDDGEWLQSESRHVGTVAGGLTRPTDENEPATAVLTSLAAAGESPTRTFAPRAVSSNDSISGGSKPIDPPISARRILPLAGMAVGVLVLAGIGYTIYRWASGQNKPVPSGPAKLERLTTSGRASDAAISPDGKFVAHVKSEAGQQSLWLRQVATTSDTQIVPPTRQDYRGITFSKDGNYIYYRLGEPNLGARTLYQVSTLGGASRKIIENVGSPITLSPDGTRLAFMRGNTPSGETALIVANAEGSAERQVAVRRSPNYFSAAGPSWSPDGKLIALGVLNLQPGSATGTVIVVEVESGAEKQITSQTWPPGGAGQVAWLADGSGILFIALDSTTSSYQIWLISYPDGEVRKITNDLNNYGRLSLTADSNVLVTVQAEIAAGVWVAPQADAGRARQISSGRYDGQLGVAWAPGGKIIYTSRESGQTDIWSMDVDGKDQKQLTARGNWNDHPWVTPDGLSTVFSSTRSDGIRRIWRMDADGGNLKQLTEGPGDFAPSTSSDGRWVLFHSTRAVGALRLWKVSIDGGGPVRLTDKLSSFPTVSPDGSVVACWYRDDGQQPNTATKAAIIPFAGGDPVKVFDMPSSVNVGAGLRWTSDGRGLTYIDTINGVSNVWSLPLDGGPPKQLTDFKTDQIFWFDFSQDGRQLAVSRGTQTSDVVLIRDFR